MERAPPGAMSRKRLPAARRIVAVNGVGDRQPELQKRQDTLHRISLGSVGQYERPAMRLLHTPGTRPPLPGTMQEAEILGIVRENSRVPLCGGEQLESVVNSLEAKSAGGGHGMSMPAQQTTHHV